MVVLKAWSWETKWKLGSMALMAPREEVGFRKCERPFDGECDDEFFEPALMMPWNK